jgi:hypothetical protein
MPRRGPVPIAAAACAGIAAWCSIGALGVAAGGAPAARLGLLPPWWLLVLLVAAAAAIVHLSRLDSRSARPLFVSGLLILPWLPGPIPAAALTWTGPVTLLVWGAVLAGLAAARRSDACGTALSDPRAAPRLAALLACGMYLGAAVWVSGQLPGGDEPHYLVIAQSLLRDRDLQIENNHRQGDYNEYVDGELKPDFLRRGRNGQIYSIHAPGLPAVIAPAYAAAGYPGVVAFLAIVAGAAAGLLWRAGYLLTGSASAAWFGWASGALAAPCFFLAFQVYPDGPAAALVLFACLPLLGPALPTKSAGWLLRGAALAFLPWLHTRYAVLSFTVVCCLVFRVARAPARRRILQSLLSIPVASALAWFAYFRVLYGTFSPAAPYGHYTQTSFGNILTGLPGLLLDQQFGALPNAPVYAFGILGLLTLARRRPRLALELTFIVLSYLMAAASYHMWWAGHSTPARFAVPVLLLLAVPGAWLWHEARLAATRAMGTSALAVSLAMTGVLAGPSRGALAFNDRDGFSLALDWLNRAVDLPRGLPSFFRQTPGDAMLRAAVWVLVLAAAWFVLRAIERRTATGPAVLPWATPLCLGAAMMVALTLVWGLDGVRGTTPETSQVDLLRHYNPAARPVGIGFARLSTSPADSLFARLRVSTSTRRPAPADRTVLLSAAGVPAGRYRVSTRADGPVHGQLTLSVGRSPTPVWSVSLNRDLRDAEPGFTLPVQVGLLLVRAAGEGMTGLSRLELEPVSIVSSGLATREVARGAARYGNTAVYFLDGESFVEPTGFWVRPGSIGRVVVQTDTGPGRLRLFVRNSPVQNRLTLESGGERQVVDLKPREERIVELPWPHQAGDAAGIQFRAEAGFVPAFSEPGSADYRQLGCWIEVRE